MILFGSSFFCASFAANVAANVAAFAENVAVVAAKTAYLKQLSSDISPYVYRRWPQTRISETKRYNSFWIKPLLGVSYCK